MSSSLHLLVPGWLDVLLVRQQPCRATIVYCLSAPGGPAAVAAFSGPSPCMGRREPRGRTGQSAPHDVGTPVYTPHSEYTRRVYSARYSTLSTRAVTTQRGSRLVAPRPRMPRNGRDAGVHPSGGGHPEQHGTSRPRDCDSGVGTHRTIMQ